ncbi:hypothetical protein COLO4_06493 [Corchorus olitorius]|uniref:Uncharacterized protein n=1 Tax=Corchorus olitorius TaxID=93759 RepID=A0A1R3KMW2_9ROSI|nr:hypothetical protein COLO4_06493 [Corchorus olitorius]
MLPPHLWRANQKLARLALNPSLLTALKMIDPPHFNCPASVYFAAF